MKSFIKTLIVAFICTGIFLAQTVIAASNGKLVAGGCATEYFLMMDLAEQYNQDHPVTIDPRKTGNMKGLKLFLEGKTDFAFLSMHHKMVAKMIGLPEEKLKNIVSKQIAIEPVLVIVSPDANISNLTIDQLVAIFNGEITNWKEVGGSDLQITPGVLNKDAKSGLYAAFKKLTIGMKKEFKGDNVRINDPSISQNFVKNSQGGITFIGHSTFHHDPSEAVEISINGIQPTDENFSNGKYPLVSKYFITYNKENTQEIEPFLAFIDSPQGQNIINEKMISVQGMKPLAGK